MGPRQLRETERAPLIGGRHGDRHGEKTGQYTRLFAKIGGVYTGLNERENESFYLMPSLTMNKGRARLIRSHSLTRISFEIGGNTN